MFAKSEEKRLKSHSKAHSESNLAGAVSQVLDKAYKIYTYSKSICSEE